MKNRNTVNNRTKRTGMVGLCLGVALSASLAFCTQPPAVEWVKIFAGSHGAMGHCVQQTSDGGYVAAGQTAPYEDKGSAAYLVKTDSMGNTEWERIFSGSGSVLAMSVQQTADGGFILAGGGTLDSSMPGGVCLIKTDSSGGLEWQRTVSETIMADGYSVVQAEDGGYVVAAIRPLMSSGLLLFKTDSLGVRQWFRQYAIPYPEYDVQGRVQVRLTSDGGFIIGTRSLLKVDSLGSQQWVKVYADLRGAYSVTQTPDGGYAATGAGTDEPDRYGKWISLRRTDSLGNVRWTESYAQSGYSRGNWVECTKDGGYVIAGMIRPEDWTEAYIIRTDSDGAVVWYDAPFSGDAACVRQTLDGGYVVTGECYDQTANDSRLYLLKLAPEP